MTVTYMDPGSVLESIQKGVWPPEDAQITCCICGEPIENEDLSGEPLKKGQTFNLNIVGVAGDASLPASIDAHGDCLPQLTEILREKNKNWSWI